MGGAIVTHIMILLQFQQWEDNQKFDAIAAASIRTKSI